MTTERTRPMIKDEYKVHLKDQLGRKSYTLVNARSVAEAKRQAERYHSGGTKPKVVTGIEKTGRSF